MNQSSASPFADMICHHLNNRPNLRTAGGSIGTSRLFPGHRAGKHLDPQSIMQRLRKLGINLLDASNAAIQNLVAEVPLPWSPNSSATATKSPTATPKSPPIHGRITPRSGPHFGRTWLVFEARRDQQLAHAR